MQGNIFSAYEMKKNLPAFPRERKLSHNSGIITIFLFFIIKLITNYKKA